MKLNNTQSVNIWKLLCVWYILWMTIILLKLLNGLLYSVEGISFAKTLLDKVAHPSEYMHSTIVLYTNQVTKRSTRLSLVYVIVTYIWHAWVCAMKGRCMYKLLESKIFIVKNPVCFNFVKVWAWQSFFTAKFPYLRYMCMPFSICVYVSMCMCVWVCMHMCVHVYVCVYLHVVILFIITTEW